MRRMSRRKDILKFKQFNEVATINKLVFSKVYLSTWKSPELRVRFTTNFVKIF